MIFKTEIYQIDGTNIRVRPVFNYHQSKDGPAYYELTIGSRVINIQSDQVEEVGKLLLMAKEREHAQ